jgi:hypothetical protein
MAPELRERVSGLRRRLSGLANRLVSLREDVPNAPLPAGPVTLPVGAQVAWDEPQDTQWAHLDARFARVLHVFHAEWPGLRSAAGYLPGAKLAIPGNRPITPEEIQGIVARWPAGTLVIHGMSSNAAELVRALRTQRGDEVSLYGVWHGSTSQLYLEDEHHRFTQFLHLLQDGTYRGAGGVKPGLHHLESRLFPLPLLNLPPRLLGTSLASRAHAPVVYEQPLATPERSGVAVGSADRRKTALVPLTNRWVKNFYTNLLAADRSGKFQRVVVTSPFLRAPELSFRSEIVSRLNPPRAQLFDLIGESDLVLNATLSECHPMVALEALAHRVPCLTGRLALGELDRHPYQALVQMDAVDSLDAVMAAIGRILERVRAHPDELREMMADYEQKLVREAMDRYARFVGL